MPQWTDSRGIYAWMVPADGDYYVLAEKEGYLPYDSRKEGRNLPAAPGDDSYIERGIIHVGQVMVKYDLSLQPLRGAHKKYVTGYPDGTFGPERIVTRAEAATILARLVEAPAGQTAAAPYPDVEATHWAAASIAAVTARGLMQGDTDGRFRPEDPLTRAEITAIVVRLKRLAPLPGSSFADTEGHWAAAMIEAAHAAGIVQGLPDGSFQPDRAATRAELVTIINRAFGRNPAAGDLGQTFPDVPPDHWAYLQVEEAATDHAYALQPDGTEHWLSP